MNLVDINTLVPTDEKCRELLTRLRWPAGPECPRCKMPAVELETEKTLYYCKECDYQFTVTAGTIFNDSHLPLNKWFLATLLLCEAKKGMSACQIKRTLGVSYKTAWYLCHRIRAAMKEVGPMLDGTVEMDETYVGGKLRGAGKDWRGLHRTYKETVIGIRKRNGDLRFFHAEDAKTGTLAKYIQENISEDVDVVITGELPAYPRALGKLRKRHETVNHWHKEYVRRGTDIHTNTVESAFSLLKRGIVGSWHKVSAKHLSAYLDEMTFRFNRRKNHNLFLDTLRHMITAPVLTFERLTA
ncbi:MAG: IS1595 family transposase, partial [Candidatus Acidiferrales bacterium]